MTRMTRTAAALLLVGAGATFTATSASAAVTGDVDKSIVWVDSTFTGVVNVPFTDGTHEKFSASATFGCTGWFVSTVGDIATAGHCVKPDQDVELALLQALVSQHPDWDIKAADVLGDWVVTIDAPTVQVGQPSGVAGGPFTNGSHYTAQILAAQDFLAGDNALIRVADLENTPALGLADGVPDTGEAVTSIGFAGSVSRFADVDRQHPSHKSGSVSSRQYSNRGVPSTEIDAAVTPGMSGGPTLDADGKVIGINSFTINGESQAFNFVTDLKMMREFLTRNGIEPATPPSARTDGAVGATGATSAGAGAATANGPSAVNGAAGQQSSSGARTSEAPGSGSSRTTGATTGTSDSHLGLYAAGGLAFLLAQGGLVLALSRGRRIKSTPGAAPATVPAAATLLPPTMAG